MQPTAEKPLSEGEREAMKSYWIEHSTNATVETMMLDSKAADIDRLERPEVLKILGSVEGKRMVELGAGIGRFTTSLAATAKSVVALDFMQNLIDENRATNSHFGNVEFLCGDATELELPVGSQDVVFSNWLLMYLSDEEVRKFAARSLSWVPEGGECFFRESCFRQSGDRKRGNNPSHYRSPRDYFSAFDAARQADPAGSGVSYQWELVSCRCLDTYVRVKKNQNQVCWKWQKVRVPTEAPRVTRAFLDGSQYSARSIARYESVFGQGHLSPGGAARAEAAGRALALEAGRKVLDVGCGNGGAVIGLTTALGLRVHGVDLSVNAVLLALDRAAAADGAKDASFEIADAARPGALDSGAPYDGALARESLLHVADKPRVLAAIRDALAPGARLLVTDYALGDDLASDVEAEQAEPAAQPAAGSPAGPRNGLPGGIAGVCVATPPGTPRTPDGSLRPASRAGLEAHASERGYSLLTIPQLAALIEAAGFDVLEARDDSAELASLLEKELAGLDEGKVAFVERFSADEFRAMRAGWLAKLDRVRDGSMKWAWVLAQKKSE